nr:hypothetical protein [Desulfobulbaceae bacterium]
MLSKSTPQIRQFHQQRRQQQLEVIEKKRQRILAQTAKIIEILKRHGTSKAVLFGSTLNKKQFHLKSDLDLLVYNLPLSKWLPTLLDLEEIEEISDIEIDLKRAEELPEDMLSSINQHGKILL